MPEQDLPGACEIAYARGVHRRRLTSSSSMSSPVAMPIEGANHQGGPRKRVQCDRGTDRSPHWERRDRGVALGRCSRRRPPCSSTLRSIASCMSARRAGTRCGVRSHNSVDPTTLVSITVPTTGRRLVVPTGASARPGHPAMRDGGPDRSTRPSGAVSSRGDVARDSVPGTPPVGGSAGQERERAAPSCRRRRRARYRATGDLRRAKPGSRWSGVRHGNRRRAEVDDHDPTGAVDDQVGRV
jgi:hypothetical protein